MAEWLLAISRDTELTRALARLLIRQGCRGQLWAVENAEQARLGLCGRNSLPLAIVIDELFLREEPLAAVAEEFSWYAPLILVARPEHQVQVASLVAEGKADFVPRGDYFIPLAAALVERTLRWEREVHERIQLPERQATWLDASRDQAPDEDGFPVEALRIIGAILDNLELVLGERSRLPGNVVRRLGRVTDLAFDMKNGLRLLAGYADREEADGVGTGNRR
ncbi:MAG TPA: hypothetical protein VNJ52_09590 [Patescibacteria group bacterium]|nr:hypothetical protein [Patescibacteria group bacterium]